MHQGDEMGMTHPAEKKGMPEGRVWPSGVCRVGFCCRDPGARSRETRRLQLRESCLMCHQLSFSAAYTGVWDGNRLLCRIEWAFCRYLTSYHAATPASNVLPITSLHFSNRSGREAALSPSLPFSIEVSHQKFPHCSAIVAHRPVIK